MAYDQYGGYPQQQRPYYNQPPPPRGASRGMPPPQQQPRTVDPYGGQAQAGYSQDRYQQPNNARVESYVGYDDGDILDQYGTDDHDQQGYGQQYQQSGYGNGYNGGYAAQGNPRGPPSRPSPQQYREPPQRRENYGPGQQGFAGGNGQMGGPSGRGRGPPPRGYPPPQRDAYPAQQDFGPMRRTQTAPQGYEDDGRYQQYGQPNGPSPPRQKPRDRLIMAPTSPKSMPYDNPFPVFPSQPAPANDMQAAERGMAGMSLNGGRSSQEGRRPPTANSGRSQNSARSGSRGQVTDPRGGSIMPRSSNDGYRPDPAFGGPQRAMTMPQNYDDPNNGQRMNNSLNGYGDRGHNEMGAYPQGPQDPIPQRSFTSVGEMRGPAQAPQRPSTATGTRPQANPAYPPPQNSFSNDGFDLPPPPRNFMPPRPGTSQGYREGPGPMQRPGTSQGQRDGAPMQRPPATREAQIDAYMPDFDAQASQARPLQDPVGLPLDGAPEAGNIPVNGQYGTQNSSYDMHKARSQPNLREQANGYEYSQEPVPPMPPFDPQGQRRPPMPLVTDPSQMSRNNFQQQVASPNSPRQFHRPGAPPIMRAGTAESGWSDPGPLGQGTPNSIRTGAQTGGVPLDVRMGNAPQAASNDMRSGPPVQGVPMDIRMGTAPQTVPNDVRTGAAPQRPQNPDALPAHPTPVRPGLQNTRPGAADIRQQQASRMSEDYAPQGRPVSGPITVQELFRLREAVRNQPQNQAQQLRLAKKLVEAAVVLADENGAADGRTTQRNRENYVNEAYKLVKKLVANSYTDAMFYLADCYGTGDLGLSIDPKEAFVLYQSAAKLGHGPSAYRTAVCCEMGQENGGGTRKDPLKAVQWYRRGAALGDIPAMYKLGMILLKGHMGQQANLSEAIIWLERAAKTADVENPHALHELAGIFETAPLTGNGVTRDERYALEMYIKAAKFGYRNSQARLGQIYEYGQLGCAIDNRTSIHWYSKAAAQEDHDAELALSGWYLTGSPGILDQNDQEAYLWARKAALAENPKAEFAMGYFSETGIGCPKSFEDAKRWYGRAAAHRYPKAKERLDELLRGGSRNMKNKERISRSDPRKQEDCIVM